MKFTCQKQDLFPVITAAEFITGNKANFTILSNILLEAKDGETLSIKASNTEMSLSAVISARVAKTGSITLIQSKLANIIKNLSDEEILFEMTKGSVVSIRSLEKKRNAQSSVIGIPVSDFPDISAFPNESHFVTLDKLQFQKMIQKTIFAISHDSSRYVLNGIYMECEEEKITMVAIDGRRLAKVEMECPKHNHPPFSAILPHPFLIQIQRSITTGGPLMLHVSENRIYCKFDNIELQSSRLSGKFPDYSMFIPKTYDYEFSLLNREILNAINLASVLVDSESNKLIWTISENKLNIRSKNIDYGESNEDIFISYKGKEQAIGLNYKLLSEILREIETEKVEFHFNNALSPVMIKEKDRNQYLFILMPMKLESE